MALAVLAFMVVAGAPRAVLDYATVEAAAKTLGVGGSTLITVIALAVSMTLQPLQFRLVQVLEGYWSLRTLPWLFRAGVWRQRRRLRRASAALVIEDDLNDQVTDSLLEERALAAETIIRFRFPAEERLLPTTLGNVLRSAEDRVGQRYALNGVVIWPRLFPLLPADYAQGLEDEVTQLDLSSRLAVTWATAGGAGACILCRDISALRNHPTWLLVIVALFAFSWLSYRAAIESALAHGQDIEVALDLFRHRVLDAARLPEPRRLSHERRMFKKLGELYETYEESPDFDLQYRLPREGTT
jgi:hypothetical protein